MAQQQREVETLRELAALRASVERATSPLPRRPGAQSRAPSSLAGRPRRRESDEDEHEETDEEEPSTAADEQDDEETEQGEGLSFFSDAKNFSFQNPSRLLKQFQSLKDFIFDSYGEEVLENFFVEKNLKAIGKEVREVKNGGLVFGPGRLNFFQNLLNKLFASVFHFLGIADFSCTMKNFMKNEMKNTRIGQAIRNAPPPQTKEKKSFQPNTFQQKFSKPFSPKNQGSAGDGTCERCGRKGHVAATCYAKTSKNFFL